MSKHTKEPWRTDAPSGFPGDVMAGKEMIARTTITEQSNAKANARRIVACVNACAGISTEVLEQGIDAVFGLAHDMRQERNALVRQRDELLTALEKALAALETCTPADYSTGHVIHASFDDAACAWAEETARAAIVKVKP